MLVLSWAQAPILQLLLMLLLMLPLLWMILVLAPLLSRFSCPCLEPISSGNWSCGFIQQNGCFLFSLLAQFWILDNPLLINSLTINSVFIKGAEHHGFLLASTKIRVVPDVPWCWEARLQWPSFDPRQILHYYWSRTVDWAYRYVSSVKKIEFC